MEFWAVVILAIAVSLDGFGAGFAYGINKVSISFIPRFIISFASAFSIYLSLLTGAMLGKILPPGIAESLGGLLLCFMGLYILFHGFRSIVSNRTIPEGFSDKNFIQKLFILLKQPMEADFDKSGNISGIEVFFLGVALAMDAFGAGFGAALSGSSPSLTASLVGVFKFILLSGGMILGRKLNQIPWQGILILVPGLIFLLIGLLNFL